MLLRMNGIFSILLVDPSLFQRRGVVQQIAGRNGIDARGLAVRRPVNLSSLELLNLAVDSAVASYGEPRWPIWRSTLAVLLSRGLHGADPLDEASWSGWNNERLNPLIPWIVSRVKAWYDGAIQVVTYERWRLHHIAASLIDQLSIRDRMSPEGERIVLRDVIKLLSRPTATDIEESMGLDDFRELPRIMDWYYQVRPDLRDMGLDTAVELTDDWHEQLAELDVPRGAVRRGKLVLRLPREPAWTVQQLVTHHQFRDEGAFLDHCVGGNDYWEGYKAGKLEIYSVRDQDGDPCLTIEIDLDRHGVPTRVEQVKGRKDETPSDILVRGETRTGANAELAFDAVEALIDLLEERAGHELSRGDDATALLIRAPGGDLAKAIRSGDLVVDDDRIGPLLQQQMSEGYDSGIISAWAWAVEEDKSSALCASIAYDQFALVREKFPPEMKSLDEYVHDETGDCVERSGGPDEVTPWLMRFHKVLPSWDGAARLQIKGLVVLFFECQGDYDMNGTWHLLVRVDGCYDDMGGEHVETDGWADFDTETDPFVLIEGHRYAVPGGRDHVWDSWVPERVRGMVGMLEEDQSKSSSWRSDLWRQSRKNGQRLAPLAEELRDWLGGEVLAELLDDLGVVCPWSEVRRKFNRANYLGEWNYVRDADEDDFDTEEPIGDPSKGAWRPGTGVDWRDPGKRPRLFYWQER
jgi:hypothetical protein